VKTNTYISKDAKADSEAVLHINEMKSDELENCE
jgi:hypothetical protein